MFRTVLAQMYRRRNGRLGGPPTSATYSSATPVATGGTSIRSLRLGASRQGSCVVRPGPRHRLLTTRMVAHAARRALEAHPVPDQGDRTPTIMGPVPLLGRYSTDAGRCAETAPPGTRPAPRRAARRC